MTSTLVLMTLLAGASPLKDATSVETFGAGAIGTDLPSTGTKSSLQRACYNVNEPSGPARLMLTVETRFREPAFRFESAGSVTLSRESRAVEIVVLLFNVMGEHMINLRSLIVADTAAGARVPMQQRWRATENDAREYLTCIAYVRSVRIEDGSIWRANLDAVYLELRKLIPNLQKEAMEPDKPKRESLPDALSI